MKILKTENLAIEDVQVVTFQRFADPRGFFTETFRESDIVEHTDVLSTPDIRIVQANESFSRKSTVRGLHFQWNPYMGKLVRTVFGHMVDIVLDIRKGSPTKGKIIMHDMPSRPEETTAQWIWVPPGFAHGNYFLEDTLIEYLCTGEYSPGCEAGVSPLAPDLDWTLCNNDLKNRFEKILQKTELITDKDKEGFSLAEWLADSRSNNFVYRENC